MKSSISGRRPTEQGDMRRSALSIGPIVSVGAHVLAVGLSSHVLAGEPVAIVEEAPAHTGVTFMDYLDAGHAFDLGPGETLVIDYLKSCLRETIVGGKVVVGFEQSAVKGGSISRDEFDCSGRGMRLSPDQSQESGVIVYRDADKYSAMAASFGTQPIFAPIENGRLIILRVDALETPREVEAKGSRLDLLELGISLTAGGIYRLRGNATDFAFVIAPEAKGGRIPIISRLIRP
jgi:hypothetical protein